VEVFGGAGDDFCGGEADAAVGAWIGLVGELLGEGGGDEVPVIRTILGDMFGSG